MARSKIGKMTPIPPALTASASGKERYVRIGHSLLGSDSVLSLSGTAFKVYILMMRAARGKETFLFPAKLHERFCTHETFKRAKNELIEAGFITIAENWNHVAGKATVFAFDSAWKTTKKR